jgi:hypothetical protein
MKMRPWRRFGRLPFLSGRVSAGEGARVRPSGKPAHTRSCDKAVRDTRTGHKRRGVHGLALATEVVRCPLHRQHLRAGRSGESPTPVGAVAELRLAAAVVAGFQNCQGRTIAQGWRVWRLTATPPVARSRFPHQREVRGLNPRGRTSGRSGVRVQRRSTEGVRSTEC